VCRLPVFDQPRVRAKDPTLFPVLLEALHTAIARLRIRTKDSESHKKTKPEGVQSIEMAYAVSREPVELVEEMPYRLLSTRTTFDIQLSDKECALYLSFRMRYVNTRGVKGPWSDVYQVVVA
jgi:hypothetical protein